MTQFVYPGAGSSLFTTATYIKTTDTSIGSSYTSLVFDEVVGEAGYTLSSGKMYVPYTGWYKFRFSGYCYGSSGWFEKILHLYVNDVGITEPHWYSITESSGVSNNPWVYTNLLYLNAGDSVRLNVRKWDTNTATLYGYNNNIASHIGTQAQLTYLGLLGVTARLQTNPQAVNFNGFTKVGLNGLINNSIEATLASSELIVPQSGKYFLAAQSGQMGTSTQRNSVENSGTSAYGLKVQKNSSDLYSETYSVLSSVLGGWDPRDTFIPSGIIVNLVQGDSLSLHYYQNNTTSRFIADNRSLALGHTYLTIVKV